MRRFLTAIAGALVVAATLAPAATAEFPYELPETERPDDLAGKLDWMYAADKEPGNEPVNSSPFELFGVRGAHIVDRTTARDDLAWATTTGRPDVTIAVLDSGIKWNDAGAMADLRHKTRLTKGELPEPRHDRSEPTESGQDCASFAGGYDANGDGVFNVADYACDTRVDPDPPNGDGPTVEGTPMLDPQDVLIAFTDGKDDDRNGFEDDIVGWDFLDDDNDPFDDVQYGHGTGEARDSSAEANNGGELGACPNCMAIHMRVGDSFIADANRFAQATIYAVDNDVQVVQEALGTLNQTRLARQSVEYAYDHGVTIIASAADEAAQHHNWPSSYPHVIVVNSATKYGEETASPRSYLQFNGCTNFSSRITLAIPSVSCSSDATGRASGMAGLVYSAALDAGLEHPGCRDVEGDPCILTMNEVRQLMASGSVGGERLSDDVNFEGDAGVSCQDALLPTCTDPNANAASVLLNRPVAMAPPNSRSYPARKGHDQFYGFGRVNMNSALDATRAGELPPEVEIESPEWFDQVDPSAGELEVKGHVDARGGDYSCRVLVAPGSYPTHGTSANPEGDFVEIPSGHCTGDDRSGRFEGVLGSIPMDDLKALFPANTGDFDGREPGEGTQQTSNGRPNTEPYGFVVKVVAETGEGDGALGGQDLRNFHLHRDADMLGEQFPKELGGDGESSPLFVDLDGDNRNELVFATADGIVHAWRPDGSELPGWPVKGDALPLHAGEGDFDAPGAFLASVAAGDLERDGSPEVVAADFEGKVYAWNADGERVFEQQANPDWSGRPLAPFAEERRGHRNRTQHGFLGSPVLADLDQDDGGRPEIVAAGMDRHVYAWNEDGSAVPGYPVLVVDPSKVESIDSGSHAVRFKEDIGEDFNQGAIVDTPAVGDVTGDGKPEVVIGTNESYEPDQGDEGPHNTDSASLTALGTLLSPSNGRLYALRQSGDEDGDGLPTTGDPFLEGWPFKVAIGMADLLPVVGEGITGSPVLAEVGCPGGGDGLEIGVIPAAGAGYLVNGAAESCHGEVGGRDRSLSMELGANPAATDKPVLPAVGHPAFGDLGGPTTFLSPAAGAMRALDLAFTEYQQGGQDMVAAWETGSGLPRPGWPALMNDLQFLTGPSVADIDGRPGQEVVAGSAHNDLQAFNAAGAPVSSAWPKLTGDWMVANPLIGSWGTLDTDGDARKAVVALTRSGRVLAYGADAPACSPGSWPRFHHDNANSGNYERDAVAPGAPMDAAVDGGALTFTATGDDLLCGTVARYEIVHSKKRIRSWDDGEPLDVSTLEPAEAGSEQSFELPVGVKRHVAIRALDEQDNVGRFAVADAGKPKRPKGR